MKKVLMVSAKANMIQQFNKSNLSILHKLGYEITVATNFEEPGTIPVQESKKFYNELLKQGITPINVGFRRSPLDRKNIQAYQALKEIIDSGNFDVIHCHSPVGGILTRWAARESRKKGTRVIYTAHGFHFFKGGPLQNWFFYPIEKFFSKYTDLLITINQEDFVRANKFNRSAVERVPGVGVDTYEISATIIDRDKKRRELNIPSDSFLVLSVGELSERKNHRVIIEAMNELDNTKIHYLICGQGDLTGELMELVKLYNLEDRVHFAGYRTDVNELYTIADVFAFPSTREGLGLAGIEAMAAGLPILTSNINGINDYSINGITGFSYHYADFSGFAQGIKKVMNYTKDERNKIASENIQRSRKFDQTLVNEKMSAIYENII